MKPSVARSRCLEDSGLPYLKLKHPEGKKPAWRELTGPTGSGSPLSRGQPRFLMCYWVLRLARSSQTACCFREAGHILPFLLSIRMFSSFPGLAQHLAHRSGSASTSVCANPSPLTSSTPVNQRRLGVERDWRELFWLFGVPSTSRHFLTTQYFHC